MLENKKPIIIQGAMEMEIEELLKLINIEKEEIIKGFKFFIGKLNEYPLIISETQVGIINASMSTLIAIQKYNPIAIINQGIAGAHVDYIHRNDIVVGEKCVNINAFVTGVRNKDEGSNPFEWKFDNRSVEINGAKDLVEIAKNMKSTEKAKIFYGILGSGDIFDREVDRIKWIREKKNTISEDNESIAVYTICDRLNIKCIGFRVISNNEVTQTEEDGATSARNGIDKSTNKMIYKEYDNTPAKISQRFAVEYVKELIDVLEIHLKNRKSEL